MGARRRYWLAEWNLAFLLETGMSRRPGFQQDLTLIFSMLSIEGELA